MEISPDTIIYWQTGWFRLNATIVFTWAVMAILLIVSLIATHGIRSDGEMSRWQNFLEAVVETISAQTRQVMRRDPFPYLPLLGTLFLFIALANILAVIPGFLPPTGSLATTAALAVCVFFAVPVFGILERGVAEYLKGYLQPSFFMLPFNIIGEFSRTLALAVRLFGNVMSGNMIAAILLSLAPFLFPVLMHLFSILIGIVQAYIFPVLAAVYIAAGMESQSKKVNPNTEASTHG